MKTLRELATEAAALDHNESADWYSFALLRSIPALTYQKNARFIAAASPDAILALLDELDALKADAARYRLLTKHFLGWFSRTSPLPWQKQTKKDALDKALDAAIAEGAKP